jgi:hypothetical protein
MFKIPLRRNRIFCGQYALIDDEDVNRVMAVSSTWALAENGYATCHPTNSKPLYLHRVVMGLYENGGSRKMLDHINGDKLDNRKTNLRFATNQENQRNRRKIIKPCLSRHKGVSLTPTKNYRAYIKLNGKQHNLGCYATEEEAAYVYNLAAIKQFGNFAKLNDVKPCNPTRLSSREAGASGFVGVRKLRGGRYTVRVKKNGVEHYLKGTFSSPEEAAKVRLRFLKTVK